MRAPVGHRLDVGCAGCPPRLARATIGNSRPLAAWMVITRTTSSVSSATFASASSEEARWSASQRAKRAQAAGAGGAERARLVGELDEVRGRLLAVPAGERDLDEPRLLERRAHELGERDAGAEVVQVAQERERLARRSPGCPRGRAGSRGGCRRRGGGRSPRRCSRSRSSAGSRRARSGRAGRRSPAAGSRGRAPPGAGRTSGRPRRARVRRRGGRRRGRCRAPCGAGGGRRRRRRSPAARRRCRGRARASRSRPRAGSSSRAARASSVRMPSAEVSAGSPWTTQTESDSSASAASPTSSGVFAGWTPSCSTSTRSKTRVRQVEDAADRAEVLDELRLAACERAEPDRVVDGDVGPPEAVDRLLRVADDGQAARPRARARASRRRARRRSRCRARSRPAPGRCPGTRRRGGPGSGGGSRRAPRGSPARRSRAHSEQVVEVGDTLGACAPPRTRRRTPPRAGGSATMRLRAQRLLRGLDVRRGRRLRSAFDSAQRGGIVPVVLPALARAASSARGRGSRGRARPRRRVDGLERSRRTRRSPACRSRPISSLPT